MLHEKVGKHGTRNRGRYPGGSELIEQTLYLIDLTSVNNFNICMQFLTPENILPKCHFLEAVMIIRIHMYNHLQIHCFSSQKLSMLF